MHYKSYIALITPFTHHNEVDYEALHKLVIRLLDENVDGLIVNGTTAESPTLTENEKLEILERVLEWSENRCEIYFGVGSNNTCESMKYVKKTEEMDFTGYLIVTPYYNLPSQYGMYEHYATLAAETKKQIMLYNVPKRCGVSLEAKTIIKLAKEFPNITSLKQASHDMECVREVLSQTENFDIYCGEDNYILESLNSHMSGVVSVLGHLYQKQLRELLDGYEKGIDVSSIDLQFKRLSEFIFLESSPAGIKEALSYYQQCLSLVRLPLTDMTDEHIEMIHQALNDKV